MGADFAVFLFVLCALAAPLVLIAAVVFLARASTRLRRLEERTRALERALEPRSPAPAPPPPAGRAAAPEEPPSTPLAPAPAPALRPPRADAPAAPVPPPAPVRRSPPSAPASPPKRAIDWERWIGIRGAALAGGVLLALAGILLFRHAINAGWIGPGLRVALGATGGAVALVAGSVLRKRGFGFAPGALEGAGIVALYASAWAADKRYGLVPLWVSFAAMVLVTVLACVLTVRTGSLFAAVLGLVGGFATPLLLSSGSDRPIGLFSYVLLLDVAFLWIGMRRGFAFLGLLAFLGTALLEALWIVGRMGPDRLWLGVVVSAVFALLFAVSTALVPEAQARRWRGSQAAGALFPVAAALYFALSVELGAHLWPIALLLFLVAAASAFVGIVHGRPWLAVAGAVAPAAVAVAWCLERAPLTRASVQEGALVALGLALASHAACEWGLRRGAPGARTALTRAAQWASAAWLCALLVLATLAAGRGFLPLAVGTLGVGLLATRQAYARDRVAGFLGAALAAGLLFLAVHTAGTHAFPPGLGAGGARELLDARVFAALALLVGALVAATARFIGRAAAWHAPGLFALPLLALLTDGLCYPPRSAWLQPAVMLALVALLSIAAAAQRRALWLTVAALFSAASALRFTAVHLLPASPERGPVLLALALVLAAAALAGLLPALAFSRFLAVRSAWRSAALASPLHVASVGLLLGAAFPNASPAWRWTLVALVPLAAGALAAARFGSAGAADDGVRRTALAWTFASGAACVALALARLGGHDEAVIAGALTLLAWAWLAAHLRHSGLALAATLPAALALLALTARFVVPNGYARSPALVWNRLSYAHLVPVGCAIAATLLLRGFAAPRRSLRPQVVPGLLAVLALFFWINLEILNHFEPGDRLHVSGPRLPARDLAISIAWGLYALVLLGAGMLWSAKALRWASLALVFVAIGKVFLRDLDHLEGLYRVASLAGLALSLITVSLLYQRFVFRKEPLESPA